MALEQVGVELEAKDAAQYLATLERIDQVHDRVTSSVRSFVDALNQLDGRSAGAARALVGMATAADASDRALSAAGSEARDAASATALVADEAQDAARAADLLTGEAQDAARAVDRLGGEAKTSADAVDDLEDAAKDAGKATDRLGDDADRGGKKVRGLGKAADSARDELSDMVGELATVGAVVGGAVKLVESFGEALEFKAQLDATTASINVQLKGVRESSGVWREASKFANDYKLTQEEMTQAIQGSVGVLRNSTSTVETTLGVLARMQVLSPEQTFEDAALALKELAGGDIQSLVERFEVSRSKANEMKAAIAGGADAVAVLSQYLDTAGVTMDTLKVRTEGAAGTMKDLAIAQEEMKLAQAEWAQGPGLAAMEKQTEVTRGLTRVLGGGEGLAGAYDSLLQKMAEGDPIAMGLVNALGMSTQAVQQYAHDTLNARQAQDASTDALIRFGDMRAEAVAAMQDIYTSSALIGSGASISAEEMEKLEKAIEKTMMKGQEAVQGYAANQSTFLSGIEERAAEHTSKIAALEAEKQKATTDEQRAGIDERIAAENAAYTTEEQNAASAYVRQQAAQRQHLGQMLIDYVLAQNEMGKISDEKAAEIAGGLEKAYGLQENTVASTFLRMKSTIDTFAKDSSGSVEGLIGTLHDQEQQAASTQKAMDDYAKEYTATAVANFLEKKGEADDYITSLESVPDDVRTAVEQDAAAAQDDVDLYTRHLNDIPDHIHTTITVDIPDVVMPHSPTPFEVGLRGIADALVLVRSETNRLPASLRALELSLSPIGRELNNLPKDFHDVSKTAESTSNDIAEYMATASRAIDALGDSLNSIGGDVGDMGSAFDGFEAGFPAMLTPGSPTPLEIGLQGIADALKQVAIEGEDAGKALKEAFANMADSFSFAASIPRAMEDMDAFGRELTSMEGFDINFLLAGGGEVVQAMGTDAMAQFQEALADAERLRALGPEGAAQADRFLKERVQQIQELAALQRELLLATSDTDRTRIQTSIARVTEAQRNDILAMLAQIPQELLATIPGIAELLAGIPGMATGGPVSAGTPYWVGENRRRELFVPNQSGSIVPEDRLLRGIASLAQIAAFGQQQQTSITYNQQRTLNMPVQMNSSPDVGMSIQIAQALI